MDKKFIEKAQRELREDDSRKSQALTQFRDWLAKHPFLQDVRQDDSYLLQFLRCKKFNVEEAFKVLENNYLAKKRYPQLTEYDEERIEKLFKSGHCYPLLERDSEGRRIVLLQSARLNTEEFNVFDAIKLFFYVVMTLQEEEETQIAGIIVIYNHVDLTLKHLMTPVEARDFMDFVKNCSTTRQKGHYVMNLPPFANFLLEMLKSLMSEKLRGRLFMLKSSDELKNYVDQSLLPKELGGVKPEAEMMSEFIKIRNSKQALLRQIFNFKPDWTKVPPETFLSNEHGTIGSFRKLEID